MAIIDVAYLQSWTNIDLAAAREESAETCIDAATDWIAAETGRQIEQASHTTYLNGDDASAGGDTLYLPSGHRPVAHTGGDLVAVTEDGVALIEALGYSTSADVIIEGANSDRQCALVRNGGTWSSGKQNIVATYKAGWTAAAMPARVKQLCAEVALHFLRTPQWAGKASESKAGAAISVRESLSPQSADTLRRLTVL